MITQYKHSWEYNDTDEYWKIVNWCLTIFGFDGWCYKDEMLYFERDRDYEFFLLRWEA
jgi:hypothetical protein